MPHSSSGTPTPPPDQVALLEALRGVVPAVARANLSSPRDAERTLETLVPMASAGMARLELLARQGVADGWLLPRSGGPKVRYGRLAKDLGGYTVDFVLMEGSAAGHTHPAGEVNFGWAWSGHPLFDGHAPGWVVFPPGSHHVPTVTGGEMLLLYFLPRGQVAWDPPPIARA